MPHAASLQSFLDTCSQGHFDNSSAWLPLHAHCRHVVPQEHTGRHIAPNDPCAFAKVGWPDFHPYGALTDVSVCLALRAVHAYAHGFD